MHVIVSIVSICHIKGIIVRIIQMTTGWTFETEPSTTAIELELTPSNFLKINIFDLQTKDMSYTKCTSHKFQRQRTTTQHLTPSLSYPEELLQQMEPQN